MATKMPFSTATDYRAQATTTGGTNLHQAPGGTSQWDEVYLTIVNTTAGAVAVSVVIFQSTAVASDYVLNGYSLPARAVLNVLSGEPMRNNSILAVIAGSNSAINAYGYVLRNP